MESHKKHSQCTALISTHMHTYMSLSTHVHAVNIHTPSTVYTINIVSTLRRISFARQIQHSFTFMCNRYKNELRFHCICCLCCFCNSVYYYIQKSSPVLKISIQCILPTKLSPVLKAMGQMSSSPGCSISRVHTVSGVVMFACESRPCGDSTRGNARDRENSGSIK